MTEQDGQLRVKKESEESQKWQLRQIPRYLQLRRARKVPLVAIIEGTGQRRQESPQHHAGEYSAPVVLWDGHTEMPSGVGEVVWD